jgi:DNA-binding SARP family transcriptional activator
VLSSSLDSPPSDCLQIHLLGTPQVHWKGRLLPVPRRNVRGLLYYLAVQTEPVSRAQLCLLFWPDIAEAEARRNLTRLLAHLRMALPVPEALITNEDRVSLDRPYVWCDAVEFRRLMDGDHSPQALQHRATLYAGPFLTGFYLPDCPEYDTWLSQEQVDYEALYLATLSGLIESKIAGQEYPAAIGYARHYLEIDCLAEEVHRRPDRAVRAGGRPQPGAASV